jgi:F0F1-type ATP synthase assembly protein I
VTHFNVRLMDALILVLSIVVLLKMTQWFLSTLYCGVFSLIILIYFMYVAMWDDACPSFPSVDAGISFTD